MTFKKHKPVGTVLSVKLLFSIKYYHKYIEELFVDQLRSSRHFSEIYAQPECGYDIYKCRRNAILLCSGVIKPLVSITDMIAPIAKEWKSRNQNGRTTSNGTMKLDIKVLLEKRKYHWGAKTWVYEFFKTQGKSEDIYI